MMAWGKRGRVVFFLWNRYSTTAAAAAIKTKNLALSGAEKYKRYDSMKSCNKCLPDLVEYKVIGKGAPEVILNKYKENRPEVKITHSSSNLEKQKQDIEKAKDNPPNTPLQIDQTA